MYVGNHRPNKPNGSACYTTEVRCNLLGSGTEYGYRKSLIAQNPGKNDSWSSVFNRGGAIFLIHHRVIHSRNNKKLKELKLNPISVRGLLSKWIISAAN